MKDHSSKIPKEGFIRTTLPESPSIDSSQRTILIRKGNALFNAGRITEAKKIFLTTHYKDGLSRLGDYFKKNNEYVSALQMYTLASAQQKRALLIEQFADIVRKWLTESDSTDTVQV